MNDLISIIVPVYNIEKYIFECLDSITKQTYENIEIILVDDGSTDNSSKICDEFSKKDERMKVIHKINEGVSKARNIGINEAHGKYITFIDSDDYVDKNYVKFLYDEIISCDADVSICGTIDIDDNNVFIKKSIPFDNILNSEEALKQLLNEKFYTSVIWSKMYKNNIAKNVKFREDLKISEDLVYLYNVIKNSKIIKVNTNLNTYYYRLHKSNTTSCEFNDDWEKEIQICKNIIEDCQINFNDLLPYAIKRYIRINYSCMMKILRYNQDIEIYNKLKNNIKKYFKYYMKDRKINKIDKIKIFLAIYFKNVLKFLLRLKEKR